MSRWFVVTQTDGDWFEEMLPDGVTEEQAAEAARLAYDRLTDSERRRQRVSYAYADLTDDGSLDYTRIEKIQEVTA